MSDVHETKALAIIPQSLGECTQLAEVLAKSELLPKALRGKVPDVLMTILAGQEMGLAPMASLRSFHVIEGKPVMGADGMVAIVLGSGKAQYFDRVEETENQVTYETLRVGSKTPRRCTWIEMAKAAGLHTKDNWRLFRRAMLASRAKSELARDVYPDVLAGCYTNEEIISDPRPAPDAIDAEFTDVVETPEPAVIGEIDGCDTLEALQAVAAKIKEAALVGKWKDKASEKYKARKAALTRAPESAA